MSDWQARFWLAVTFGPLLVAYFWLLTQVPWQECAG